VTTQDISSGVLLRANDPHGLGAPPSAIATVETVETSRSGDWFCTIRYHDPRQAKRQYLYRSHLWDVDLGRFEIVTELNPVSSSPTPRFNKGRSKRFEQSLQLNLPFEAKAYE
jgi:hypothetical protein